MKRRKKAAALLGPLELAIMKVVWEQGDVTVAEVVERLRSVRHHNTVMTVMRRLARKGLLERYERDGRTHGYRARVSQDEICRQYLDVVREQFFAGSAVDTLVAFLGADRVRGRRLTSLRRLVDGLDERGAHSDLDEKDG